MHYLLVLYISISQDVATQLMMMMCKTTEISHHFDLLLKVSVFLAILSGVWAGSSTCRSVHVFIWASIYTKQCMYC